MDSLTKEDVVKDFRTGIGPVKILNKIFTCIPVNSTDQRIIAAFASNISSKKDFNLIWKKIRKKFFSSNLRERNLSTQLLKKLLLKSNKIVSNVLNDFISEILNAFLNPRMRTLLELSFNATRQEVEDLKKEVFKKLENFCSSELTFENWVRQAILAPRFPPERWLPQSVYPQCWRANEGYLNLGYLDFSEEIWIHLATLDVLHQIRSARVYQLWYSWRLGTDRERSFPLINGVEIEMMLIPPGKFWMGSPEDEKERHLDKDRHQVLIKEPFWCAKYPVTQEQYKAVIGINPSHFQGDTSCPVEEVNWEECQEFCKKTGHQLLTEAQWEYACRAGTTTAYSFGDDPEQLADHGWYHENSGNQTHPVGQKQINAFGLHDMHGNVWEWCEDLYQASAGRVNRGGGWDISADWCRSAYRGGDVPSFRRGRLGLRVCRFL